MAMSYKELLEKIYGVKLEDPTPEELAKTRAGLEKWRDGQRTLSSKPQEKPPEEQ